ncbi:MAG: poly-gamma-glutamate synthase PgsB [Bacteroidetes bacterium]|nr:poly-gamma-glutamate synthase PgsB [Bacteroidota bacterium]
MIITVAIIVLILLLMIGESLVINNCVKKIAVRIHINGTRGKSTITKYIFSGLKEDGLKVLGKVTGEIPTLLFPDGSHKEIKRRGTARVQEQFNIIRKAKKEKVDVLILECMSIDPILQNLESFFFRPDIYIISNIRDDHREKMGNSLDDQIKSICDAIPSDSKIIAGESAYIDIIKRVAIVRNSQFIQAINLTDEEKKNIPQLALEINVQLALTACIESGIPRQIAFKGILKQIEKTKSPLCPITNGQQKRYFLNAFSVNDIPSFKDYLKHWTSELSITNKISVVFNTRSDRPLRTGLFVEWIKSNHENIDTVILTGDHKMMANRLLSKSETKFKIKNIPNNYQSSIKDLILESIVNSSLIVGVGNIKGLGYQIINEFAEAS